MSSDASNLILTHGDRSPQDAAGSRGQVFAEADNPFFLTGGDQPRITSQPGGTPVEERVRAIHAARLHVLVLGNGFDLRDRRPAAPEHGRRRG